MYYLTDPHLNSATQLHVLAQSGSHTFPSQVSCLGVSIPKAGKISTGFLAIICQQSGHSKSCEVFRDSSMVEFVTEFKAVKKRNNKPKI